MSISNNELLRHILDEVDFVLEHTQGIAKEAIFNDAVLNRAIIRSLEIVGEAARKLEETFKTEHPHIAWRKMAGTRDKLIHDYFGVDYDIVWDIIENKLPQLKQYITEIVGKQ